MYPEWALCKQDNSGDEDNGIVSVQRKRTKGWGRHKAIIPNVQKTMNRNIQRIVLIVSETSMRSEQFGWVMQFRCRKTIEVALSLHSNCGVNNLEHVSVEFHSCSSYKCIPCLGPKPSASMQSIPETCSLYTNPIH